LLILIGHSTTYVRIISFVCLAIEAIVPIPQFISHFRHKSVVSFRLSVMIAWLFGDLFKTSYFFFGDANVTWQFKACTAVQISFDLGIGAQFFIYGNRQPSSGNGIVGKYIGEELEEGVFG